MEWPVIGWVDAALIAALTLSALVGLFRGLTFELLSLAGWFAAWFAALWFGPILGPYLPVGEAGSTLNRVVAFASAFLVVLLLWGLAARGIARLVRATPLRPLDRLLGAMFGLARGVLVLLALTAVLAYTPLARAPAWQESQGAAWLQELLREVLSWVAPPAGESAPARSRV
ncbi:MAG TPA: CvpA family protein [Caldimonas sp.]|jgi:membrane protein required for colicin V production|nr:CvpA family protein [Caldimonas sp.]HEX2540267.1 CvpA family protein [Caldimonas sp.]